MNPSGVKSFDIRPRRTQQKPKAQITEQARPMPARQPPRKPVSEPVFRVSGPKRKWPKVVAAATLAIIFLLLFLGLYVLPEARIEVQARTEPVTRDFEVRVDQNEQAPSLSEMAVPGKILEDELTGQKTYGATGRKNIGQKASGFVHIYNFTKTTLILKANTTVLSSSGREYYFTQDVGGIRPTAFIGLQDQEVDESSLIPPVPVVAAQAGTEYNLPKGARLEIKNEVLGSDPKTLYGIVADDVAGGTTKEVKVVTDSDIAVANQNLSKELIGQAKQNLRDKYGVTALDNAMAADVLEPQASVKPGTEAAEFSVSQKVKFRAFVFDEKEVKSLVLDRIKRLLPENKVLDENTGQRFSAQFAHVTITDGVGVLVAHYEGQITYQVKTDELTAKLKGKNVDEIKEILLSRPEIESAKIKFYPFWVKRAPKLGSKISLKVISE